MPGLIAMTAVFVVVGIEMFFASKGAGHSHAVDYDHLGGGHDDHARPGHKRSHSFGRYSNGNVPGIVIHDTELAEQSEQSGLMAGRSPALSIISPTTPTAPNGHAARRSIDSDNDSDLDISMEELARQQDEEDLEDKLQGVADDQQGPETGSQGARGPAAQQNLPVQLAKKKKKVAESWDEDAESDSSEGENWDDGEDSEDEAGEVAWDEKTGLLNVLKAFKLLKADFDTKFRAMWA